MKTDVISYLSDAIERIERGGVDSNTGSHLAGIFGKAANGFEKEISSYVNKLLDDCSFDYERDLRATIMGPIFVKLTLGNLIAVIREASRMNPKCVSANIPGKQKASEFTDALQKINQCWVQVKHGGEVEATLLITHMKSMLILIRLIRGQLK